MRKRPNVNSVHKGLAILAGAFSFAGTVEAATVISEGFDGAVNIFSAPTYAYSLNYTAPNLLLPAGGLNYMHGGAGISGSVSTNVFTASASPFSLLVGGITAVGIDAGLVSYNLYAQFSSYLLQGDYGTVRIRFLDAASNPLGSYITVGGSAFVGGLPREPGTDLCAWGADATTGLVPAGARFAAMDVLEVKAASGTVIDGYIDNIDFGIQVVPEPTASALLGLGGTLFWLVRRRR